NVAERALRGGRRFLLGDHLLLRHHRKHLIAALARVLGMSPGRIEARAADHPDEQRRLAEAERPRRMAEVVPGGRLDAHHRDRPALAEIDRVEVGREDLVLAMRALDSPREPSLAQLSRQRALVRKEYVLHELLG